MNLMKYYQNRFMEIIKLQKSEKPVNRPVFLWKGMYLLGFFGFLLFVEDLLAVQQNQHCRQENGQNCQSNIGHLHGLRDNT